MKIRGGFGYFTIGRIILSTLPVGVYGTDILKTTGFTTCLDNSTITVTSLNIQFDRATSAIDFDVGGASSKEQNVTASLIVTAYGKQVYKKDFNPCDKDTKVTELCPGELKARYFLDFGSLTGNI